MSEQLRQAIRDSGLSLYGLSKKSGVTAGQLSRFMRGERDLSLAVVEKVCDVLGMDFTRPKGKK